jgi:hypothetical protein
MKYYSVLKFFTGFDIAARMVCAQIVINPKKPVITTPATINQIPLDIL